MPFSLAPDRVAAARALAAALMPGQRVCLTTHVNPDGDGLGSEAGLAHLLRARGVDAVITNPTPTPAAVRLPVRGPARASIAPGRR